jgi:peptidoglycan/LPS O-acetylase OafA/YrhL
MGFYRRRTLRIFPACYVYIAFIGGLAVLGIAKDVRPQHLLYAIVYATNYVPDMHWAMVHLWSLAVEEQFYLIWPFVFLAVSRQRAVKILTMILIVVPFMRAGAHLGGVDPAIELNHMFVTVADALATGCLLALIRDQISARGYLRRLPLALFNGLLFAVLLLAVHLQHISPLAYALAGNTVINVIVACFVARSIEPSADRQFKLLNSKAFIAIGLASYSIYLWQQPFLYPFDNASLLQRFPLNILTVAAAASLSFFLVERPLRAFAPKLAVRARSRSLPLG